MSSIYFIIGALKDETESIFHYSLTNGNYSLYNDHHSKPRFLEDLVGNLTALFSTSSTEEVARFNSTCMGNKQCLLTIARTGNINEGKLIMETYRKEQYAQEIIGKEC